MGRYQKEDHKRTQKEDDTQVSEQPYHGEGQPEKENVRALWVLGNDV